MSFGLRLATDTIQVDAGSTVPISFEVSNLNGTTDTFEVQFEGVDIDWVAIPDATFDIGPEGSREEKVFLKVPRVSESTAGTFPFVLRVRSLNSGQTETVQGVLEVRPFHHISVDVSPRKGTTSSLKRPKPFMVTIMNLGNTDHTMQLFASDTDDATVCEFSDDKIQIGAGQQRTVELVATGKTKPLLSNPRLHGLVISARSTTHPTVSGQVQAQIEQRALITPGSFFFLLFGLCLFVAWILLWPHPPAVKMVTVAPEAVTMGQPVEVRWKAVDAEYVRLTLNGKTVEDRLPPESSRQILATYAGSNKVEVTAFKGSRRSPAMSALYTVTKPPEIPKPEISSFDIQPRTIKLGEKLLVSYAVNSATTKLTLSPPGNDLDLKIPQIEITPTREGTLTYRLVAQNSIGDTDQKSIEIKVVKASLAEIRTYSISPKELEVGGGTVRLTWHILNCKRATLTVGTQTEEIDPIQGVKDFQLTEDTIFTITAYDAGGLPVEKKAKVTVKQPPPTVPEEPTTDPQPSTTGP